MVIVDSNGSKISDGGEIPSEFIMPEASSLLTEEEYMIFSPILQYATPRPIETIIDMETKIPKDDYIQPEQKIDDVGFKKLLMEGDIEYLDLSNCYGINDFRGLSQQKSLIQLSLVGCSKIKSGDFLRGLNNLEILDISGTGITDLEFVRELPNLKMLCLRYTEVTDLSPVSTLRNLHDLVVLGCHNIGNFSGLEKLTELRLFDAHMLTKLRDISFVRSWKKLENLLLDHCKPDTLEPIRELYMLKVFSMNRDSLKSKANATRAISPELIEPFRDLTELRFLDLRSAGVCNIKPLEKLIQMNSLDLGYGNFVDLTPLAGMTEMRKLVVDEMAGVFDFSPLENMTKLFDCDISGIRTPDISVLKNFTELELLDFNGNVLVRDLSPIENLTKLIFLDIHGCLVVDDLYYTRKLTNLIYFFTQGCPRIKSGWPIRGMEKLIFLDISSTSIPHSEISEFKRLRRMAKATGNTREIFYKNAMVAFSTRKKINSYRVKLNF
jgi:Leucine-rich repeat (LRR) protein